MAASFTVNEVYIPTLDEYDQRTGKKLREFQNDFRDCVNEEAADVIQLIAPTGAGKTFCFEYILEQGNKVLLLYPTNALIKSQLERFKKDGFKAIHISSKSLEKTGYDRSQELKGLIDKYDIVLSNPDIFQAIIGRMYWNPEENLMHVFRSFNYVIYDEFHAYKEFELSGILMQIALFQNLSYNRTVLSSATPKSEILELLSDVRIGKERRKLIIKDIKTKPSELKENSDIIRYKTKVNILKGKIFTYIDYVIKIISNTNIDNDVKEPQILVIFDSVKECNLFYNLLYSKYPEIYKITEKDNGYDTKQVGNTIDFTKPILLSTNKSELGLDYPIKLLLMEDGFSYDSFIQRFGRVARKSISECYIFTKKEINPLFLNIQSMDYNEFLKQIEYATDEYNIKINKVRRLYTFRQALAIGSHERRREDIQACFVLPLQSGDGLSYKKWSKFLLTLEEKSKTGLRNDNLQIIISLVNDFKKACGSLRGRPFSCSVIYQRGHEPRETVYDVLRVLNSVPATVKYTEDGLIIREMISSEPGPFIEAIEIPYLHEYIQYKFMDKQFKEKVKVVIDRAFRTCSEKEERSFLSHCAKSLLCDSVSVDKYLIPETLTMVNGESISLSHCLRSR